MGDSDNGANPEPYDRLLSEIIRPLAFGVLGYTHFAVGELNTLRRNSRSIMNGPLNAFLNELERHIYASGIDHSLNSAMKAATMDTDKDVDFYVQQARDFKSHVQEPDIEKRIAEILWVLWRR